MSWLWGSKPAAAAAGKDEKHVPAAAATTTTAATSKERESAPAASAAAAPAAVKPKQLRDNKTNNPHWMSLTSDQDAKLIALADANEKIMKCLADETDDASGGWKLVSKSSDIWVYNKSVDVTGSGSAKLCFKGIGIVPASPLVTLNYLWDLTRKREYDSFFDSYRILYDCGGADAVHDTQLNHQLSIGVLGTVSPRDMVFLGRWRVHETESVPTAATVWTANVVGLKEAPTSADGPTIVMSARTIDDSSGVVVPPLKGYVRATIRTGGYVIRPVKGDPNKSIVTYIGDADLNGSLPGFITNQIYARQPMCLAAIRPYLAKMTSANTDLSKHDK